MEKKFFVIASTSKSYKTYEDAEAQAKRFTTQNGCGGQQEYIIAESLAMTKMPVPEIEVVKF